MKTETWRHANTLFEQVLDVPVQERAAWLDRACADQPALRAEVERRLQTDAEAEADGFLAQSLVSTPEPETETHRERETPAPSPAEAMPPTLGPYRIVDEIGRGGMGTVYAAERDDDAFQQQVAIKVMTADPGNRDVARRLREERRILALLEHPNIARIYDGGTMPDGRPYFVMERVSGLSIDTYCAQNRLSIPQRVRLMVQVGRAVDYAHRNLVVHRDLKPSNILVTESGDVKLLDFGIAKLLASDPGTSPEATAPWRQHLTLHYASPEQLRGQPVSTASDVYALGVLLYRLLTGAMPRSFDGASPWQAEHDIVSSDVTRPSLAAAQGDQAERPPGDDRQLGRRLAGDLDAIALKALRADPEHRYRSAGHLVDDLERFTGGLPVGARRGTFRYRAGKLLKRNPWATALAGVALAVGLAFVISTVLSERRLAAQRATQEATLQLLLDMFEDAGPYAEAGKALTLREAIDRQADRLDQEGLDRQPEVAAQVHSTLGWLYLHLGASKRASKHHEQALELHRRLNPNSTEVAASLDGLASALRGGGEYDRADTMSAEALALHRRVGSTPRHVLRSLNERVTLFCWQEEYAKADALSTEALTLAQRASENDPEVSIALMQRAAVLRGLGNSDAARRRYLDTEAALIRRHGTHHPTLATLYNNLANIEDDIGHGDVAIDYWRRSDAQYVEAFGDDFYVRAVTLTNLSQKLATQGDLEEAEATLHMAMDVARRSPDLGPEHQPEYAGRPALALAALLRENGRCDEVDALLTPKIETWTHFPHQSTQRIVASARALLARCGPQEQNSG